MDPCLVLVICSAGGQVGLQGCPIMAAVSYSPFLLQEVAFLTYQIGGGEVAWQSN